MSWLEHHTRSEEYADLAEEFARLHEHDRAVEYYRMAAEAEAHALIGLDLTKTRTVGITAVSTASLWFKAGDFRKAEQIAHQWLATDLLPDFAIKQLQALLQVIWSQEAFKL